MVPTVINFSPKKKSNWNPGTSNYGYRLLDTYNLNYTDTKTFCSKYAGCFNSQNDIKYVINSDFARWFQHFMPHLFLIMLIYLGIFQALQMVLYINLKIQILDYIHKFLEVQIEMV